MQNWEILILTVSLVSLFVILIPMLCGILIPSLKPIMSKNANKYLYAFSAGFFLIMATVLFIAESKEFLLHEFEYIENKTKEQAIVGVIIAGVVLFCLLLSLGAKFLFSKSKSDKELDIENHDKMIFNITDYNPKSKALAIFFLLTHRVPDGIIIGILCSEIAVLGVSATNVIFLCSYIIHVVPEELIIYYRQREMGISKKKAILNNLIATCIIVPLIICGSLIGWYSLENNVAIAIIQLVTASFLLFVSIIEFIPEFLHETKIKGKTWYIIMLIFIIGVVLALFLILFHDHGDALSHT